MRRQIFWTTLTIVLCGLAAPPSPQSLASNDQPSGQSPTVSVATVQWMASSAALSR